MNEKERPEMKFGLISAAECANRKGVTRQAVVAAIRRGALPAQKIGPNSVIKTADCDAYRPALTYSERGKRNAKTEKPAPGPKRRPGRPRKMEAGHAE